MKKLLIVAMALIVCLAASAQSSYQRKMNRIGGMMGAAPNYSAQGQADAMRWQLCMSNTNWQNCTNMVGLLQRAAFTNYLEKSNLQAVIEKKLTTNETFANESARVKQLDFFLSNQFQRIVEYKVQKMKIEAKYGLTEK